MCRVVAAGMIMTALALCFQILTSLGKRCFVIEVKHQRINCTECPKIQDGKECLHIKPAPSAR